MAVTATNAPDTTTTRSDLELLDAWWRAANYLSVGQIYLMDNPLLREPLRPRDGAPRAVGGRWTPRGRTLSRAGGPVGRRAPPRRREPLRPEPVKPRLLGHWGTTPGLTFLW